jgi:hypothetical protein
MEAKKEQRLLVHGLGELISTAAFCGALAPFVLGKAHAATSFDGAWSVVVSTDSGSCDPTNRLGLDIRDGALHYAGDSGVLIRGRVANSGLVQVRVSGGNLRASGSGRLSANSGTGTWRGSNSSSSCTGRWSAERG